MSLYEQAVNRIRGEYLEMPGLRLTPEQVERMSGVESAVCRRVLDDLVRARFLDMGRDGRYARRSDLKRSRSLTLTEERPAHREMNALRGH